jgi:uncharacterized damage-inducible protein DinB
MTREDLLTLLEFNAWARERMLGAVAALSPEQFVRPLGNSFSSVRDTLVHTCSADWIWYMRCHGQSPTALLSPKDYPDLDTLATAWTDMGRQWQEYLESLDPDGHTRRMDYRLMNGQPATSLLWQIVQHMVNHGTYHRGQITTLLRQLGAAATSTDLITFHRERRIPG